MPVEHSTSKEKLMVAAVDEEDDKDEEFVVSKNVHKKKAQAVSSANPMVKQKESEFAPHDAPIGQIEQIGSRPSNSNSKKLDLSPIKQVSKGTDIQLDPHMSNMEKQLNSQYNIHFQETDEDLQDKLKNLFKDQPDDKEFDDNFTDEKDEEKEERKSDIEEDIFEKGSDGGGYSDEDFEAMSDHHNQ